MTRLAALFARLGPDPRADGTLLAAFLADRDESAFAELVRRHGPTVWGVCRRTLPDPADAEDAFQATFLVLLRRARGFDPERTVGPWLYRVAVLTSRGLRRKNARRRTVPLPDIPARPEPPAVDVDALLMRLPERERAAVVLCHLHGLTQRQAADRLGVPEGTLSARLSRGLAKLRRHGPLAGLMVAVPAGVAEAAVTVATAGRAAGPGVTFLVTEVLRMFWLKKLATAGLAVAAVGGFGLLVTSTGNGGALAQTPPTVAKPATVPKVIPPPVSPPLEATRAEALVISAGEPHLFRTKSGRPLAEVFVQDDAVANTMIDPKNAAQGLLTGVQPGTTQMALKDDQGTAEAVIVAVGQPRLLQVMLAVGEHIDLTVPNRKVVRKVELIRPVRSPADLAVDTTDKLTFRVTARTKGVGFVQATDDSGLVWRYSVTVIELPAKAKPK